MANDNYVNSTGLSYFWNRIKTVFAKQTDLAALSGRVDDLVAEGGEPNAIETVKVNGRTLTPDGNKAVDINAGVVSIESNQLHINQDESNRIAFWANSDNTIVTIDAGEGPGSLFDINLASVSYVNANGGKIDKIKVNGTELPIAQADKSVDISVQKIGAVGNDGVGVEGTADSPGIVVVSADPNPILLWGAKDSATSDYEHTAELVSQNYLDNLLYENDYQNSGEVQAAINAAIASAYIYKGSVATLDDLPTTGQTSGDVYDVQATGMNYAWNGTAWDALGQYVDTSLFILASEMTAITTAQIDAITSVSSAAE